MLDIIIHTLPTKHPTVCASSRSRTSFQRIEAQNPCEGAERSRAAGLDNDGVKEHAIKKIKKWGSVAFSRFSHRRTMILTVTHMRAESDQSHRHKEWSAKKHGWPGNLAPGCPNDRCCLPLSVKRERGTRYATTYLSTHTSLTSAVYVERRGEGEIKVRRTYRT
jgi:hypothetical protein